MKYTISVNQKVIIETGLGIDYKDASILDACMVFCHSNSCIKMEYSGKIFYWFNHGKIAEELPLLGLKKDSVYRRMKKMCDLGLLSQHPDNEIMGKSFYCFEESTLGLFTGPSENKTYPLGKPSVKPSDEKPTYNYTNDNYTNDNISSPEQVQEVPDKDLKVIDFIISKESTLEEKIIKQFHQLFCEIRTKPGQEFTNKTLKKSKMSAWKSDLDKIMRIDKKNRDDLKKIYDFLKNGKDDFWRNTIFSLSSIREYWDQIEDKIRMEELKSKKQTVLEQKEGVFAGNINNVTKKK